MHFDAGLSIIDKEFDLLINFSWSQKFSYLQLQ